MIKIIITTQIVQIKDITETDIQNTFFLLKEIVTFHDVNETLLPFMIVRIIQTFEIPPILY